MATTFLQMTNRVLRRLNEVALTEDTFGNARGLHATIKDAVIDAIKHVNRHPGNWPWNAAEHTMTLTTGVSEYSWPVNFKSAEWRTFQIQKDDTWNVLDSTLIPIDRDVWYERFRDDTDNYTSSWTIPRYVFESHGHGFAVSPTPDRDYTLTFRYYVSANELVNWNDELAIPDQWNDAVYYHAVSAAQSFKENAEQAQYYDQMFREAIREMEVVLLHRSDYFRDTRVNVRHAR